MLFKLKRATLFVGMMFFLGTGLYGLFVGNKMGMLLSAAIALGFWLEFFFPTKNANKKDLTLYGLFCLEYLLRLNKKVVTKKNPRKQLFYFCIIRYYSKPKESKLYGKLIKKS